MAWPVFVAYSYNHPQLDLKVYVEALLEFSQVSVAMINLASEECHMFQLQGFFTDSCFLLYV